MELKSITYSGINKNEDGNVVDVYKAVISNSEIAITLPVEMEVGAGREPELDDVLDTIKRRAHNDWSNEYQRYAKVLNEDYKSLTFLYRDFLKDL